MGAVGEGAHATHESIVLGEMVKRRQALLRAAAMMRDDV